MSNKKKTPFAQVKKGELRINYRRLDEALGGMLEKASEISDHFAEAFSDLADEIVGTQRHDLDDMSWCGNEEAHDEHDYDTQDGIKSCEGLKRDYFRQTGRMTDEELQQSIKDAEVNPEAANDIPAYEPFDHKHYIAVEKQRNGIRDTMDKVSELLYQLDAQIHDLHHKEAVVHGDDARHLATMRSHLESIFKTNEALSIIQTAQRTQG